MTLIERAQAALDDALHEAIKHHFAGFVGQVDGDLGRNVKGNAAHFAQGIADVKAAYEAAVPIIQKAFGDAS